MNRNMDFITDSGIAETLEIQQSAEILGMSCQELAEYLEKLSVENPVVEIEESYAESKEQEKLKRKLEWLASVDEENMIYYSSEQELEEDEPLYMSNISSGIIPDVVVVKFKDHIEVLLSDFCIPAIRISDFFRNLPDSAADEETKKYAAKKLQQAEWVLRCVEQRNSILLAVTKAIVEIQKDFFGRGRSHATAMSLRDVADRIGIQETTVGRAVMGKFLQSPWGIYPLKYFFMQA